MCAGPLFLFFSFCLWVLQTNLHLTSKKSSWPTDGDALIFQEAIFYLSLLDESHSFFKPKQFTSLEASVFNEEPRLQKRGQWSAMLLGINEVVSASSSRPLGSKGSLIWSSQLHGVRSDSPNFSNYWMKIDLLSCKWGKWMKVSSVWLDNMIHVWPFVFILFHL